MKYLLLAISFLAAGPAQGEPLKNEAKWTENCYRHFYKHVTLISGNEALDCGFSGVNASTTLRAKIRKCAKDAMKRGIAYKVGYAAFGYDSAFCQAAVKDTAGRLWLIEYDSDTSGGSAEKAEPVLWVSECRKIFFRPDTVGNGSFFTHEQCEKNSEIARKVLATP